MSSSPLTPELSRAGEAFGRFFGELRHRFPERDHILEQVELALISREHQLIFGPPGTGKSELASTVTRNIVDEQGRPSFYSRQIVETTVQQDLIGPVDFKVLTETGRTQHRTDEGLLAFELAVINEAFDARDLLLRSLFSVLNEREFAVGPTVIKARLQTALFTTNRYLSELLAARPETLLAFSDRVAFAGYVPKGFADPGSRLGMLSSAAGRAPPVRTRLTLGDLALLRSAAAQVEVDDEALTALATLADLLERGLADAGGDKRSLATRYLSGRALSKAVGIWRAAVVRDRLVKGRGEPLRATAADLGLLRPFFTLAGPPAEKLDFLASLTTDPRDQGQLNLVKFEQKAFSDALKGLRNSLTQQEKKAEGDLHLSEIRHANVEADRLMAGSLAAGKLPEARHPKHRDELARLLKRSAEAYVSERARPENLDGADLDRVKQIRAIVEGLRDLGDLELATRVAEAAQAELRAAAQALPLQQASEEFEPHQQLISLKDLTQKAQLRLQDLDDLERQIGELGELAGSTDRQGPAIAALFAESRVKTAKAIRRRAGSLFRDTRSSARDLSALHQDTVPLIELDHLLNRLSPGSGKLRIDLLSARAAGLLRKELAGVETSQFLHLLEFVRSKDKNLRTLEVEPSAVFRVLRPAIAERAQAWASRRLGLVRPGQAQCSEMGYWNLLKNVTAWTERAQLAELIRLVRGEGDATLQELGRQLEEWDLLEVQEMVGYLSEWFQQVSAGIVPGEIPDLKQAEDAWTNVSKSKFFTVTWRDKELVTLRERIRELSELPRVAERARQVGANLELLLRTSEHFGRALLERRAALSSAA